MSSIYKRPRSPFWWIKFEDSSGRIIRQSLKLKWSSAADTQRALIERNHRETDELERAKGDPKQRWESWVPAFIELHYQNPLTLRSYSRCWRYILIFLRQRKLHFPAQVGYQDCVDYVAWRAAGDKSLGVLPGARNTALCELKVFSVVMKEARRRGFCAANPCASLGINKSKPKVKPEISTEHLELIHAKLAGEPEWMLTSFLISLYTGCRLSETRIELATCVDLERRKIHFADPKGGKPFTIPMRDELQPMFMRLIASGAVWTYDPQPMASIKWIQFFRRIGLPQYSFHCLRVTFISIGARAGIDERAMMRLVNHARSAIHAVYQRFSCEDLRAPLAAIPLPSLGRNQDSSEAT